MVIKMSKINEILWKLAEKFHSLAANISGILSIMKYQKVVKTNVPTF
jgi:hypothetical protein